MNAITPTNQSPIAVSNELLGAFSEVGNIADRISVPSLSTAGKVWTKIVNGEKVVMSRKDDDGDRVPISVARVYVVGAAPERGRALYVQTYDRDNPSPPDCWSVDSKKPDQSVIDAVVKPFEGFTGTCASCPMAVKGSKTLDNGKTSSACQQHKMLAIIPANGVGTSPVLRLRLAITSVYDGKPGPHEADGWHCWDSYVSHLRKCGVPHTALVRTKMKFDSDVEYPKVLFAIDTSTPDDIGRQLLPIVKSDEVRDLLAGTWTPAGADAVRVERKPVEKLVKAEAGPTEAERLAAQEAKQQAALAEEKAEKARKAAEKKAAKEAADAAKKKAEDEAAAKAKPAADDDEDEDGVDEETPSKPYQAAPAKTVGGIPADVADLLADWDA